MADPFAALRALSRPKDAVTVWVETDPDAIHFLDAVFSAGPGLGNVRREFHDLGARKLFKLYVAPGCLDDALQTLRRAARFVPIGEIEVEP